MKNFLILWVVCVIGFLLWTINEGKGSHKPAPINMFRSAEGACQRFIREAAGDPSAIDFPRQNPDIVEHKNDRWTVVLLVRGKNAYNATILTRMGCSIRSDGDSWVLLRFV